MDISASDLLANPIDQSEAGYVPVSAIVIIAALDPETGQEHLIYRRDTDASIWKHIGMLTVCCDGWRQNCRDED